MKSPSAWGREELGQEFCSQHALHGSTVARPAPFLWLPWKRKGASEYSTISSLPSEAQPANRLNSPFAINTRLGHFKCTFCLVLFFSPSMKRALLPLRVYVPSFHGHGSLCHIAQYFKRLKSLLTILCHWISFSILVPRDSFSFLKNKGSCQYSNLAHNLFQDDIWPRRFAF